MNMNRSLVSLSLAVAVLSIGCNKEKQLIPDKNNGGITLPEKFGAIVVVDTISRGRHMAINSNGDIYLHLSKPTVEGKGIVLLRDTAGNGRADLIKGYSDITGTGIEVHNGYLYYADNRHVFRSKMTEEELLPAETRGTLVTMVDCVAHTAKTSTSENKAAMYVNIGSRR